MFLGEALTLRCEGEFMGNVIGVRGLDCYPDSSRVWGFGLGLGCPPDKGEHLDSRFPTRLFVLS